MLAPTRTGTYGGFGGVSFDDSHDINAWGQINQIVIRHGSEIDALGIVYANGNTIKHGGSGGSRTIINLEPGEFISQVTGRSGERLDRIKFTTSKGKEHGPFGGNGGSSFELNFDGKSLLYFFGRAGNQIDRIGFGYGDMPPALPSTVQRSIAYGGNGGSDFDDLNESGNLLGKISSIKVRHGSVVDNIAVRYKGGSLYSHGGNGGNLSEFTLEDDEWVTEVRGRFGRRIDQIQFFLNSGRISPTYGGNGGSPFTLKLDGYVVKAFFGRSGNNLDQIGVYFEDARPLKIEIISMDYDIDQLKILEMPPQAVVTALLENNTDTEQEVRQIVTITESDTNTTSISQTNGLSVKFSVEQDFLLYSGTFEVGYSAEIQYTTESSRTVSKEFSVEFWAQVPPKSKIKAVGVVRKDSFDVPWTAQAKISYQNRSEPVISTLHGTLKGIKTLGVDAKYDPVSPL